MVWRCVVYYIVSHRRRDTVWYHTPTVVTLTNSGTCTEHKGRQYILTEQLLSVMYINIAWRSGNIIICIPNTFIILYQTLHLTWTRLVSQNVSLSLIETNHIPLTYSISFLSSMPMLTSYTHTHKTIPLQIAVIIRHVTPDRIILCHLYWIRTKGSWAKKESTKGRFPTGWSFRVMNREISREWHLIGCGMVV